MVNVLLSVLPSRFNQSIHPRRPVFLLVVLGLLEGCAAEPAYFADQELAALATRPRTTAYNKPYKVKGITYSPLYTAKGYQAYGIASWYGAETGKRTASGLPFNPQGMTAAHKTLPIPSTVRVTNLHNGRYVDVVINDRGPFSDKKLIDLSQGAANQIGVRGLAEVKIEYIGS